MAALSITDPAQVEPVPFTKEQASSFYKLYSEIYDKKFEESGADDDDFKPLNQKELSKSASILRGLGYTSDQIITVIGEIPFKKSTAMLNAVRPLEDLTSDIIRTLRKFFKKHLPTEEPEPKTRSGQVRRPYKCRYCKEVGHNARTCAKRIQDEKEAEKADKSASEDEHFDDESGEDEFAKDKPATEDEEAPEVKDKTPSVDRTRSEDKEVHFEEEDDDVGAGDPTPSPQAKAVSKDDDTEAVSPRVAETPHPRPPKPGYTVLREQLGGVDRAVLRAMKSRMDMTQLRASSSAVKRRPKRQLEFGDTPEAQRPKVSNAVKEYVKEALQDFVHETLAPSLEKHLARFYERRTSYLTIQNCSGEETTMRLYGDVLRVQPRALPEHVPLDDEGDDTDEEDKDKAMFDDEFED